MKVSLSRFLGKPPAAFRRETDEPIRSELFSVERLEQHGESLAAAQRITPRPTRGRQLVPRLRNNARALLAAYRSIGKAVREERAITPAAEWLIDNFHIVEEQVREIRDDLPRGFYRQLPKLSEGAFEGFPRVFGVAWAFIAHTDSRFEPDTLRRFVRAYQRVQPLTIGELWALAITLRIVLVENLRRIADQIERGRLARHWADELADRLLGLDGDLAEESASVLRGLEVTTLPRAFAVQLVQRLRDQDPAVTPALRWLDERLAAQGTSAEEIVGQEHQRQGAMNVTVRNIITSMRLMSAVDWAELFESVSLVDEMLRDGSDFAAMDFATRDRYRHAIEALARGSGHTELEVAEHALRAAARPVAGCDADCDRFHDPGYYLISLGRPGLEAELNYRATIKERLAPRNATVAITGYAVTVAVLSAVLLSLSLLLATHAGVGAPMLLLLAALALVPASDAAVAVVNHLVTHRFVAHALPAMELRDGIPASLRTMVVVPTLLTSVADVEAQIERLEVRYLASAEGDIRFALLSDWTDSATETAPGDDELVAAAAAAISRLNIRHARHADGGPFLLLHRRRVWNPKEAKWIGWERKRGKLHELNHLLRGATDTTFLAVSSPVPTGVRYVITLDADTRLPRGAAKRMVGKMAHPLNHARFDSRSGRVVEGYGVLQPRVSPTLPTGREGSLLQRVTSGPAGLDPYACAVSDVYQDLLGEGSYTGKGIYDVDAFEAALHGRVPDNTLLSHDLLEGVFVRAGLTSDIEVFEEAPSRYDVSVARQHRWARGDWQLLPWIVGFGPSLGPNARTRPIPFSGRWKLADNLRRTLSAPTAFLALLAGWMLPDGGAWIWTASVLGVLCTPSLLPVLDGLVPQRVGISKRSHILGMRSDLALAMSRVGLQIVFLAHQAWLMADAIVRTLVRLLFTHRHMLEWTTAAQSKFQLPLDVGGFYRRMAGGVLLAVVASLVAGFAGHEAWPVAAPLVLLWLAAPAVAQWASRPPSLAGTATVSVSDAVALRCIARRTWRYFETFVVPAEHMLPPDNFQQDPKPVVAHRTSPTNMGLYLLSVVAARDFGWLGTTETVDRIAATLQTMQGLERMRGHFYNWYDTQDLRALEPKYISSVDSGNLAGHLIALGGACREMIDSPVMHARWTAGIGDALALARTALDLRVDDRRTQTVTRKQLREAFDAMAVCLDVPPAGLAGMSAYLADLTLHGDIIVDIAQTLAGTRSDGSSAELLAWAGALQASIASHARDFGQLVPWATLGPVEPAHFGADGSEHPGSEERALAACFDGMPSLGTLGDRCAVAIDALTTLKARLEAEAKAGDERVARASKWIDTFERSAIAAGSLERRLTELAKLSGSMFAAMEFGILLDPERKLLSIGCQADGSLDPSCYDLLASEARLASFVAIAKGDLPARHWFHLGRALTPVDRGSALVSWSGSMFEYLMPSLVMRAPAGSLLEQTSRLVVRRQIQYGAELGVPWGVSESAYNVRDLELTYQYSNFGVPGLGLKRGLSEDAVIAPYATALAAMVDPRAAAENFSRLQAAGGCGDYGFCEALDYTPARLPAGEDVAVVRAWMAHHQGMTVIAIANALHDGAMRTRFHAEPIVQATELLLQERTPRDVAVARPRVEEVRGTTDVREMVPPALRRFHSPHGPIPRTHLLSNGRYAVMLTAAGSGYSRWQDLAVTRWREDVTCDDWGSYVFVRDVASGEVWSAGFQPTGIEPDSYEVEFDEGRAEIARRDGTITTTMKVAVSPEDDAEVRHISISNLGNRVREIELTSYSEIVLAPPAADAAHPVFSKLFVKTEFVAETGLLVATRRARTPGESAIWAGHLSVVQAETVGQLEFETDRARFLGRGGDVRTPNSMQGDEPLSGSLGDVLDPVFSLRHRLRILPGATARVAFWTLVAPSRGELLDLADKHRDATAFDRAMTLAWTQAQVQLRHLGCAPDEAHVFQRLASHVLYANPALRPSSALLQRNERGQSALWAHAISGDLPIVLVRIDEAEDLEIVRQLLRARQYWRMKLLAVDLVIVNERPGSYAEELQDSVESLVRTSQSRSDLQGVTERGNVFVLRADRLPVETRTLLHAVARVVLLSRRGSLFEQIKRLEEGTTAERAAATAALPRVMLPRLLRQAARRLPASPMPVPVPRTALEFFNGLGGFADGGREYVTILGEGQRTPAPWINVIANASFGFQVSAEGGGYTWAANSRQHQLTPWSNDPVGDRPGEAIYLRDEDSGALWCPTALPIRDESSTYTARHGQGYSRFEHATNGIGLELVQYVPLDDPIKISRLRIHNRSAYVRRLSVTAYVEWVLGTSRDASAQSVATEMDADTNVMLARNPWNSAFGNRFAFIDLGGKQAAWTGDRGEFLGRNGTMARPAALAGQGPLSGNTGAGFDPCGVLQAPITIEPNASVEIVFTLGDAASRAEALGLARRYRVADLDAVLRSVTDRWEEILGSVQVKTPDRPMDILLNGWLLYQTLACRVFARSAFYQASGAYGFRDQLQDTMALAVARPSLVREHLLRAAARQFVEGDMQHWWMPPSGQGVRTRISDDKVWLAWAADHYMRVTGDRAVLDERVAFLEGAALLPGQHDAYFEPMPAEECGTLFEHCARGLDASLAVGDHGLPLIGGGDWNDGMNRVGEDGRGESVWLGWFLHATLSAFAPAAEARGETERASSWRTHAAGLKASLEREGWDGDWYRRGYFDDGSPLGSSSNEECRIDSIAQSWGVISGAADPARAARAMAAVDEHLVRRKERVVLLFTPPFANSLPDPGYIRGYPRGVRENGGQYTHAAAWTVIAFAMLGDGDRATELFSMLNPINHAATRAGSHRYKVEPYAIPADVYSEPPHAGRGGWTWYTGSAGWMYRAGLERILGLRIEGEELLVDPCIPKAWPGFEMILRHRTARYEISVENPLGVSRGVARAELDGVALVGWQARIALVDDGATHNFRVVLG